MIDKMIYTFLDGKQIEVYRGPNGIVLNSTTGAVIISVAGDVINAAQPDLATALDAIR